MLCSNFLCLSNFLPNTTPKYFKTAFPGTIQHVRCYMVRASDFSADWWFYWFSFAGFSIFPQQNLQTKNMILLEEEKEANFTTNEFKFEQKIELRGFILTHSKQVH